MPILYSRRYLHEPYEPPVTPVLRRTLKTPTPTTPARKVATAARRSRTRPSIRLYTLVLHSPQYNTLPHRYEPRGQYLRPRRPLRQNTTAPRNNPPRSSNLRVSPLLPPGIKQMQRLVQTHVSSLHIPAMLYPLNTTIHTFCVTFTHLFRISTIVSICVSIASFFLHLFLKTFSPARAGRENFCKKDAKRTRILKLNKLRVTLF